MTKPQNVHSEFHEKTLLIGVQAPYNPTQYIDAYYEEFINLVESGNFQYDETLFFKLRSIDPGYFFTKGKLEEIADYCNQNAIKTIIVSEPLSAMQARNLADACNTQIIDRTELILKIFENNALSAEGKIQVQIAKFEHEKSRLAGKGIDLEQQSGSVGLRSGAGETAKEREKRHLNLLIKKMRNELENIAKTRDTQRKRRLRTGQPMISLVGYTNAGKSTILNTLTRADVIAEDRPFATLDTTTRELFINSKKKALLSDTVGFIQLLPHHLIEAFKSTLSELAFADLLLHVVDIADPNWQSHIETVLSILHDLEIDKPMLYIFNKADKLTDENISIPQEIENYAPHIVISAVSRQGIEPLIDFLSNWEK